MGRVASIARARGFQRWESGSPVSALVTKMREARADGNEEGRHAQCCTRSLPDATTLQGDADVVYALPREGNPPDCNVTSPPTGRSAPYTATERGHEASGRALIVTFAGVNLRDTADKCGVLAKAVRGGSEALVEELLAAGANPNERDEDEVGCAPLHHAAAQGHEWIISVLVVNGADIHAQDKRGCTPLHHAISQGHVAAVQTILGAGADVTAGGCFSALVLSACKGNVLVLQSVLDHGADPNARDIVGRTALHAAAEHNRAEVIYALVKAGADVNVQRFDGGAPLHYAAFAGSREATLALLRLGASVDLRHSKTRQTPLHVLCQHRNKDVHSIVDLLLRWGASEKAVGGDGRTAVGLLEVDTAGERAVCSEEEIEGATVLLERAAQGRAWRRRCWSVMLRWRVERTAVKVAHRSSTNDSNSSSRGQCTKPMPAEASDGNPSGGRIVEADSGDVTSNSNKHEEAGGVLLLGAEGLGNVTETETNGAAGFKRLVSMLVGLMEEGIFRVVVGFL